MADKRGPDDPGEKGADKNKAQQLIGSKSGSRLSRLLAAYSEPKLRATHEALIAAYETPFIATIALPKLNRAKMYAHETAAIKTMQTIHTAQTQYQSQFGRFATSLVELGPPQSGQPGPQSADLIDNNLARDGNLVE